MKILKLIMLLSIITILSSCEKGFTKILQIYQQKYPKGVIYVNYQKDVVVVDSLNNVYFILTDKLNGEIASIIKIK